MSPSCNLSCQWQDDPGAQGSSPFKPRTDKFSSIVSFCPAQAPPAERRRVGERGNPCMTLSLPTQPVPVSSCGGRAASQLGRAHGAATSLGNAQNKAGQYPEQPGVNVKDQKVPRGPPPAARRPFPLLHSAAASRRMQLCASRRQGWVARRTSGPLFLPVKVGDKVPPLIQRPQAMPLALGAVRACCSVSLLALCLDGGHPKRLLHHQLSLPCPGNTHCRWRCNSTARHGPVREDKPPRGGCCPQPSLPAWGQKYLYNLPNPKTQWHRSEPVRHSTELSRSFPNHPDDYLLPAPSQPPLSPAPCFLASPSRKPF